MPNLQELKELAKRVSKPPMSAEDERIVSNWQVVHGLQAMLAEAEDPTEALQHAKKWLAAWSSK